MVTPKLTCASAPRELSRNSKYTDVESAIAYASSVATLTCGKAADGRGRTRTVGGRSWKAMEGSGLLRGDAHRRAGAP